MQEQLARVRSPAGLDLGPGSQEEIAVAILAELVAWSHTPGAVRGAIEAGPFVERLPALVDGLLDTAAA